jgi:hypothetical protein
MRAHRVILILLGVARSASGQRVGSTFDLGGSSVRYDSARASAITASPGIQANFDRATAGASGSYSFMAQNRWTTQGIVAGSAYVPIGAAIGELALSAGGTATGDGSNTGQTLALVRAHAMRASRGAWLGVGAGRAWDGIGWSNLTEGETGLWARPAPNATIVATLTPVALGDSTRYADAELAVRWFVAALELAGSAGARLGRQPRNMPGNATTWASVNVVAWLAPSLALVGAGGTYPVDLTQGFPGGRFVSLSLRVGTRTRRNKSLGTATRTTAAPAVDEVARADAFEVVTSAAGRTLRVLAPLAHTVELNADFTDWSPVSLTQTTGGWWERPLTTSPGPHQLNIRVDGGSWMVPKGLMTLRDEFGGEVGLVIVP